MVTNFHTHTTYCDGADTPRDIIEYAIRSGLSAIGFSGHSYTPFDETYCMTKEGTKEYYDEVMRLAAEYADDIRVYCGIERDYFSEDDDLDWDYVIGAVHYVEKDGEYIPVDESPEILMEAAKKHYGGDIYALIEDYYKEVGDIFAKTGCDIVAHFDLITEFNERKPEAEPEGLPAGVSAPVDPVDLANAPGALFNEKDPRYVEAWQGALRFIENSVKEMRSVSAGKVDPGKGRVLAPEAPVFEINTGAMSRGYKTKPYPSLEILRAIVYDGFDLIMSSDSHEKGTLQYAFDQAVDIAVQAGVTPVTEPPCLKL